MGKKKIVIVGGGYVGFEVAQKLDAVADVTLIEQREAFVQPPAAIRSLVQPELLEQIILPYDGLLKSGRVVRGRAVSVAEDAVTVENGDRYVADYIVIATGSTYAAPFKPAGDSIEDFRQTSADVAARLKTAETVVIVGAGAVGTELAGEIASAQPGKKITLISSDDTLFPMYPAKLGANLERKLKKLGVTVVLGQRVQDLQRLDQPYEGSVTLADGSEIAGDMIFPVIGSRPQATLIKSLPGVQEGTLGRVRTDGWLRPSDYANVFVAGDIADVGDGMTIVATARQNPWLVKTLKALVAGETVEKLKPYSPWKKAPILVPLGPIVGNSWLFTTVGDRITRMMKGKELFIPKYRKAFGMSARAK
ncbi:NADH dehydrogenase FAD-containing subunit [Shimia isoporae]|uniref:NADH dehydrogenase FAD-containing subunit n=1 Tax=Shimia isoporae TaxID=647720 RepID=A0A4R1N3U7_9RHOB|nr:FAD-dependent oxidoreductase [Shimia isoporae]TCL00393.1 NADH dehydrogenase FAD-containing subunit [Shimia isoporae]